MNRVCLFEAAFAAAVAFVLTLLLVGCATLPVHAPEADAGERLAIDTAADGLGLRTEYVDAKRGAVEVEIWEGRRGEKLGEGKVIIGECRSEAGGVLDTAVLRQELGHALGLGHVADPANVMNEVSVGGDTTELTRAQRRRMRATLLWLRACRGAP